VPVPFLRTQPASRTGTEAGAPTEDWRYSPVRFQDPFVTLGAYFRT
jgi:hypothetical protein